MTTSDSVLTGPRPTSVPSVGPVVAELEERLASATRQAVTGALDRASRTNRPRHGDIDWNRTIAANLKHYQPEYRTVIPERLIGNSRRSSQIDVGLFEP